MKWGSFGRIIRGVAQGGACAGERVRGQEIKSNWVKMRMKAGDFGRKGMGGWKNGEAVKFVHNEQKTSSPSIKSVQSMRRIQVARELHQWTGKRAAGQRLLYSPKRIKHLLEAGRRAAGPVVDGMKGTRH